jgi:hypothetical protein
MDLNKVFRFRDGVQFFAFDEQSFIVDSSSCAVYDLGLSSALISAHLDGWRNLAVIVGVVKEYFNVSSAAGAEAVAKFIKLMEENNLIEETI